MSLENLYANMTAVCEQASLEDLLTMLRVIRDRLAAAHPVSSGNLGLVIVALDSDRRRALARKDSPDVDAGAPVRERPGCVDFPE